MWPKAKGEKAQSLARAQGMLKTDQSKLINKSFWSKINLLLVWQKMGSYRRNRAMLRKINLGRGWKQGNLWVRTEGENMIVLKHGPKILWTLSTERWGLLCSLPWDLDFVTAWLIYLSISDTGPVPRPKP